MEKEINQALADLNKLDFVLGENKVHGSDALAKLNEFLIQLMIDEDIYDIKENLSHGDTSFLQDILYGEYQTPYFILKDKAPNAIIHEFLEHNISEDAECFIEELNRLYEDIEPTVDKFLELINAVVIEYL
jgi:hypothetical protein